MIDQRQTSTLTNGIIVATDPAPNFHGVAIAVSFRIGSVHEPDSKAGISHLLEHVVFRGSTKRDGDALQQAFAELGADINGRTDEDSTTYTVQALREDLPAALGLVAELTTYPKIASEDMVLEKQIIEQENCRGCPNCSIRDAYYQTSYPDQSIGNPVIGYEDTLASIAVEDLKAYHRAAYVGSNLTIAICGDLEHELILEAVENAFCQLPKGDPAGYPELRFQQGDMVLGSGGDRASIRIGWNLASLPRSERRPIYVFSDILGGHGQSTLMQELREKRGLVYGAWADEFSFAKEEILFADASGEAVKMGEIARVLAQTSRDTAINLQQDELDRAKRRIRTGMLMGRDYITSRVERMVAEIAESGRLHRLDNVYEEYMNLTLQDVKSAGQKVLETDPTIIAMCPVRSLPKFEDIRGWFKGQDAPAREKRAGFFGTFH